MRLNMGAGNKRLAGYTGIDAVAREAADIVAPAHAVPLPDACAEEVLAIHLVEHLLPWTVPDVLREWARLLKPGGLLVIEAPDLMKACRNILEGYQKPGKHPDQFGMWALYGDTRPRDEHMLHRWAYTFATLTPLVEAAGFKDLTERPTVFHSVGRERRDFRLEALRRG